MRRPSVGDVVIMAWVLALLAAMVFPAVVADAWWSPGRRKWYEVTITGLFALPMLAVWGQFLADRWLGRPGGEQAADYDDRVAADPGAAPDPRRHRGTGG